MLNDPEVDYLSDFKSVDETTFGVNKVCQTEPLLNGLTPVATSDTLLTDLERVNTLCVQL